MANINSTVNIVSIILIAVGLLMIIIPLIFYYHNINPVWFWVIYLLGISLIIVGITLIVYYNQNKDPPSATPSSLEVTTQDQNYNYGQVSGPDVRYLISPGQTPTLLTLDPVISNNITYVNEFFNVPT